MLRSYRIAIFLVSAIITILYEIVYRIFPTIEQEPLRNINLKEIPRVGTPSTITDYPMDPNEFIQIGQFDSPSVMTSNSSVMTNYDRYDSSTFSYSPYVPYNVQNEDILDEKESEVRAIFQKKYCTNGQIKFPDFNPASGPAPVNATRQLSLLSTLVYPRGQKCNPCDEKCEYSIPDKKLATEEFLVRPKGTMDEEIWLRIEQVWNRVFYGVKEIVFV